MEKITNENLLKMSTEGFLDNIKKAFKKDLLWYLMTAPIFFTLS